MTMDKAVLIKRYDDLYADLKTKLDEFRLKTKLGTMEARDAKAKLVHDLHERLEAGRQSWQAMKDSSNDQYRQFLADCEGAWNDISTGFKKAAHHFDHEDDAKS